MVGIGTVQYSEGFECCLQRVTLNKVITIIQFEIHKNLMLSLLQRNILIFWIGDYKTDNIRFL